jgi:uncharacterized protein
VKRVRSINIVRRGPLRPGGGACAAALAAMLSLAIARAGSEPVERDEDGIVVLGNGQSMTAPDTLEIGLSIGAAAELTADATTKFTATSRRLTAAIEGLGIEHLEIRRGGLRLGSSNPSEGNKSLTSMSRSLRIIVRKIDALAEEEVAVLATRLVDAAKDNGATLAPSGLPANVVNMIDDGDGFPAVKYLIERPEAVRDKAYHLAFDDARRRAERLAALAGARVGRVRRVEEVVASTDDEGDAQMFLMSEMYGVETPGRFADSLATHELSAIAVHVSLRVRFEILYDVPADSESKARTAPEATP